MKLSNLQFRQGQKIELSTTSMIDVVFLMLIYFMVTTTFQAPEKQLLPNIRSEKPSANVRQNQLEPAVVDVFRSGNMDTYRIGGVTTTELERLGQVLDAFPNKFDGAFVRVDDRVKFESAVAAINECKRAGFEIVTYVPAVAADAPGSIPGTDRPAELP